MASEIAAVAEAVKDAINAADLSVELEAQRVYVPKFDLRDLEDIAVRVVARSYDRTNASRSAVQKEVPIDIGVAKLISPTSNPESTTANAELDGLIELVEEIAAIFDASRELADTGAWWIRTEVPEPLYDVEALRTERKFLSVIRVTLRIP